jgi:RNase adapter protein RapZ
MTERRMVVVAGLSGAGKTVVLNALEDCDYYCMDNLPVRLWSEFLRLVRESDQPIYQRVAVGIDARNPIDALATFPQMLREIGGPDFVADLVFVEASESALLRRFSETRRKHPLSVEGVSLSNAIQRERQLLSALSEGADIKIDTSDTLVHQLRDFVRERIARRPAATLSLQLTSFGFKHGVPHDADFLFDVRCLPNPHWLLHLRNLTGKDPEVIDFLRSEPNVEQMVAHLQAFLDHWIPIFAAENRSYLTVAIGCTGGHHRSVYIVESLARHFSEAGRAVLINHRDL